MTLPASFATAGFTAYAKPKLRGVMIGTEGAANSGKSEFILSAPGPSVDICLDRGMRGTLDNPNPPASRQPDHAVKLMKTLKEGAADQATFLEYWKAFRKSVYDACAIPEARSVCIDGDSDSCEVQMIAEFGRTTQIMPISRTGYNAARRLFYSRLFDSGKIIIATNKLKRKYEAVYDETTGKVKVDGQGQTMREWDGASYERQGFNDFEYLWEIQVRHLYNAEKGEWGIRILMCKANREFEGTELWGDDCSVYGLLTNVYSHIDPKEWGFK